MLCERHLSFPPLSLIRLKYQKTPFDIICSRYFPALSSKKGSRTASTYVRGAAPMHHGRQAFGERARKCVGRLSPSLLPDLPARAHWHHAN